MKNPIHREWTPVRYVKMVCEKMYDPVNPNVRPDITGMKTRDIGTRLSQQTRKRQLKDANPSTHTRPTITNADRGKFAVGTQGFTHVQTNGGNVQARCKGNDKDLCRNSARLW